VYRSQYNPYFKTNARLFPALEFMVQLLQHPQQHAPAPSAAPDDFPEPPVSTRESRSAWARLLARRGPSLQPLRLPHEVLAVVNDPPEVRRILLHLVKTGVAPPGLEASALN
jgi:hypothetical protein